MKLTRSYSIGFVGSGKIAGQLAQAFRKTGIEVEAVYSPQIDHRNAFAQQHHAKALNSIHDFDPALDAILICVPDKVIAQLDFPPFPPTLTLIHTSGTGDLHLLQSHQSYGVLYPIQSFTNHQTQNLSQVPLCIEANDERSLRKIEDLARAISSQVHELNSEKRRWVHLTAVLVNNFPNALYALAENLLSSQQIPFEWLHPIIQQTTQRLSLASPILMQTGPAVRNDSETLATHQEMLAQNAQALEIYQILTQLIINQQKYEKLQG
jgi:predicted short-subunit dehydrogenase-like oxidoreductase (DUF2520 family)